MNLSEWRHFNGFEQQSILYSFVHEMPLFFKLLFILITTYIAIIIIKSVRIGLSNNAKSLHKTSYAAIDKQIEDSKEEGDSITNNS